jgi:mycofactocin precursor
VTKPDGNVALATGTGASTFDAREGASPRRVEAVSEEVRTEEGPRASEEIVIEEIGIDGMGGVLLGHGAHETAHRTVNAQRPLLGLRENVY